MREMFNFLLQLKGNAKTNVLTEPLFGIPLNLYAPFFTLYMFSLGVDDIQIGIIMSIGLLFQIVMAFLGGVLSDKFGRRRTTFIGNFIAWSIPCLIWIFSQNFWWFLVAAIFNTSQIITSTSEECLWVDDIQDEDKTEKIIHWQYIIGLSVMFVAPISGFFVERQGVVPVMRILFIIAFVSMTVRALILYFRSTETQRGQEKMKSTKDVSLVNLLWGYKDVFKQIWRSHTMLNVAIISASVWIIEIISNTFFALYATQDLGLQTSYLAYFAVLNAGVMLIFLFAFQDRLDAFKPKNVMLTGLVMYIVANAFLLAAPPNNWIWLAIYIVIEACAGALFLPKLDNWAIHTIKPTERARIYGSMDAMALVIASPFGFIAGTLSEMDRRLPFLLNVMLFVVMIYFVFVNKDKKSVIS